MSRWLALVAALALPGPAAALAGETAEPMPRVYEEEFHLRADRQFELPGWRGMDRHTAALDAEAGCRALGTNCSEEAGGSEASGRFLKSPIVSDAYRGTAWLTRVRQDSYYAKFVSPRGYSVCRAGLYLKGGILRGDATFSASIQRSGLDGLSVYADLGPSQTGAAEFRLLVLYVPRTALSARRCWPDQTILVLCHQGSCQPSRAYPETDLR